MYTYVRYNIVFSVCKTGSRNLLRRNLLMQKLLSRKNYWARKKMKIKNYNELCLTSEKRSCAIGNYNFLVLYNKRYTIAVLWFFKIYMYLKNSTLIKSITYIFYRQIFIRDGFDQWGSLFGMISMDDQEKELHFRGEIINFSIYCMTVICTFNIWFNIGGNRSSWENHFQ